MMTKFPSPKSVLRLAVCPALAAAIWVSAPAQPVQAANGVVGKGAIDITGSWQRYPVYTLGFTNPDNDPNAKRTDKPFVPPSMPTPPLKPEYLKEWHAMQEKAKEANAKGQPLNTQVVNCLPEGMPTMMGPTFPMEILQTKGMITIIEEAYTQVRHIYLDQKMPPLEEIDPSFYGTSVGHWDNGVLTVETMGVKEDVKLRAVPHSDKMLITEKIKQVAPDILWDEITITDPEYLEKPWTYTNAWTRMPDYKIQEYICEDNREFIDANGVQQQVITPDKN